jgi:NTP pyrophosphatase (non-canonical NTP hydrolase)
MKEQEIYRAAIDKYGYASQYDMLIEEMAELTQAILKARRRSPHNHTENLHEEFVDVKIVMAQIELVLNPQRLEFWKQEKLARLERRILDNE